MHDHLTEGVFAAAGRDRHLQRGGGQVGVVVLADAESDDAP